MEIASNHFSGPDLRLCSLPRSSSISLLLYAFKFWIVVHGDLPVVGPSPIPLSGPVSLPARNNNSQRHMGAFCRLMFFAFATFSPGHCL